MAGPVPTAPLNRVAMLTDYITLDQRIVARPNEDVVYGAGSLALDITPVVIQVAKLRRALLGLSSGRSAHRRGRATRQNVRHDAQLLHGGRPGLAWRCA